MIGRKYEEIVLAEVNPLLDNHTLYEGDIRRSLSSMNIMDENVTPKKWTVIRKGIHVEQEITAKEASEINRKARLHNERQARECVENIKTTKHNGRLREQERNEFIGARYDAFGNALPTYADRAYKLMRRSMAQERIDSRFDKKLERVLVLIMLVVTGIVVYWVCVTF